MRRGAHPPGLSHDLGASVQGWMVNDIISGFNHPFWFECAQCGSRVSVEAEEYTKQEEMEAVYPTCQCGKEIDISTVRPVLRSLDDPALNGSAVSRMAWFHTSLYKYWPDEDAYRADVLHQLSLTPLAGSPDGGRAARRKMGLALHLGTYEAAIENMLRRAREQDIGQIQYWLDRVLLRLEPGDLHPTVMSELRGSMGDVELSVVHDLDARVVRYVNAREAAGSVSLAVDPSVIREVSSVAIPVAQASDAVAPSSEAVTREATTELDRLGPYPDTEGFTQIELNPILIGLQEPVPNNSDDSRRRDVARRIEEFEYRRRLIWRTLAVQLIDDYLYGVSERVADAFLDAVTPHDDPSEYHYRFRSMAGLLTHPSKVIDACRMASGRTID